MMASGEHTEHTKSVDNHLDKFLSASLRSSL